MGLKILFRLLRFSIKIRDLIATREGACSATLATMDDKIEEREVSEESMCIKEIGE